MALVRAKLRGFIRKI